MYVTINQACERLGKSRWTIYKLIEQGELEAIKAPGGKNASVSVSEDSLTRYISRRRIVPRVSR